MKLVIGIALLVVGTTTALMATGPLPAPEIDPSTAGSALALLAGALVMLQGRRKR